VLILAFDTSGFAGSAALLDGPFVLAERRLDPERRSAQTLAPTLAAVLAEAGISASQIDLVATTVGPGSFTGLRVGVTTAKTFAYAANAEVIGVSTLEAIAMQLPISMDIRHPREIHAVLNAQRNELFVGRFRAEAIGQEYPDLAGQLVFPRAAADSIVPAEAWLASLPPNAVVAGTGLERLRDRLPNTVMVAPQPLWEPSAAMVGRLAFRDYEKGRRDDLWKLAPVYLRPSAAEEKANNRSTGGRSTGETSTGEREA
jgi:tRNA threonylcarbamoyladenosine biosynthesis protein TsaB